MSAGVTIISEKSSVIRDEIVGTLGRSVTVYQGKGTQGASEDHSLEHEIIFTVVTRLEIGKLQNVINRIDDHAVVIQHNITNMQGGMINRKVH